MSATLRRAGPGDAALLSALSSAAFRETYAASHAPDALAAYVARHLSRAAWDGLLADGSVTVVAERDGAAVGYVQVAPAPLPAGATAAASRPFEVRRLYVRTAAHGRGLGRALLDAALDVARAAGGDLAWLSAWEHNHGALAFYARCGWREAGETGFDFEGTLERDLVLVRDLG